MLRFFILFIVILVTPFAAELTQPVQSAIVLPWTAALVRISAGLIMLFVSHVAAFGKILQSTTNGFAISVEAGCNGIEAAIVLSVAMLTFPAPWKHRVIGIFVGLSAVQVMNIVRVISLFYFGQWNLLGWRKEAIALGYQIGNLIFPSLIPIVLWAIFNRRFLVYLPRSQARNTLIHARRP